jgi:DNA-binding beta-propeller fold protein YncE
LTRSIRVRLRDVLVLVPFLLLTPSCRSKEQRAAAAPPPEAASAAPAPAPTPTELPVEPPKFTEIAAAGEPYSSLREPRGAALDAKGRLWVADFGGSRLRVFDPAGGYLGGWGGKGADKYGFNNPTAVAVSGDTVYVADTWNGRVESFSLAGSPKASVTALYGPRGVAVAPGGAVVVADTGNNRLMFYDAELKEGRAVGSKGSGPEQFSDPVGVAVGPSGAIYVADVGNRRIQILDGKGRFTGRVAVPGWTSAGEPFLAVGAGDVLYVSDPDGSAVLALNRSGKVLHKWEADDAGRKLASPTGLAMDSGKGTLYVVDKAANTVSRLALGEVKTK